METNVDNPKANIFTSSKVVVSVDLTNAFLEAAKIYYDPAVDTYFNIRDIITNILWWVDGIPINREQVKDSLLINYSQYYEGFLRDKEQTLVKNLVIEPCSLDSHTNVIIEKIVDELFNIGILSEITYLHDFKVIDYSVKSFFHKKVDFTFLMLLTRRNYKWSPLSL